MLEAFSVVALASDVAPIVHQRYGDLVDRFSIYAPYSMGDDARTTIVAGLRAS